MKKKDKKMDLLYSLKIILTWLKIYKIKNINNKENKEEKEIVIWINKKSKTKISKKKKGIVNSKNNIIINLKIFTDIKRADPLKVNPNSSLRNIFDNETIMASKDKLANKLSF